MNLRLDWCSYDAAKYAVENWHYSERMPHSKLVMIGAWEEGKFIGAVIFGVGANNHLVTPYGLKNTQGCELVRVALQRHKAPVSKIVSIAIRLLHKANPGLRLIVSYADPKEGHVGGIYQAGNWIYTGQTIKEKAPVLDGRISHNRVLSLRVKAGRATRKTTQYVELPGKYRYLYPLDDAMRKRIELLRLPYPRRAPEVNEVIPGVHPGEGGATPTRALQI